MRWLKCSRGASRPRRTCDSLEVQSDHHGLAFDKGKRQIGSVGHSRRPYSVDPGVLHAIEESSLQTIPQTAHAFALLMHACSRELCRFSHAGDGGDILGSRTAIPFRVSAVHQGPKMGSLSDVQCSHSLRSTKLVRGNREQVHAKLLHIDGNFSGGLHSIGMKSDSLLRCNFTDLFDGLYCSDLVIREHQRDQYSLWTNRAADIFRIYEALAIDGQNGGFYSTLRQGPARVKHRNVLYRRRNYMLDFAGRRGHSTENRVVVRFRASTGKHDIRGARA